MQLTNLRIRLLEPPADLAAHVEPGVEPEPRRVLHPAVVAVVDALPLADAGVLLDGVARVVALGAVGVRHLDPDAVPDLVEEGVAAGGAAHGCALGGSWRGEGGGD